MAKEQLTAAPSDTFTKQNIENFQNCNTFKEDVNNQCKKTIYHLKGNIRSKEQGQVRPPTESNSPAISHSVPCY